MPAVRVDAALPDLSRLIMRRAGWLALLVLAIALAVGLWRMADDIDDEMASAQALARLVAGLGRLAQVEADDEALASMRALQAEHPMHHLRISVHDEQGRELLAPPPAPQDMWAWAWLLRLHEALSPATETQVSTWSLLRPDATVWRVTLTASPESERREAMASLVDMMAILLAGMAGLLLVMHLNVRRALAPLDRLLASIAGIETEDTRAVQSLPRMPIRELEALAMALRQLGAALERAQAQRRLLSQQVLTLQEDERARLARELHDEFGQRLTAMRVDATWLARRMRSEPFAAEPHALAVVEGLAEQCGLIQQDVRQVLARLNPLARTDKQADREPPANLAALLQQLVDDWRRGATGQTLVVHLRLDWQADDLAEPGPWPMAPPDARALAPMLPRLLVLSLYRISQEALTNVARHAQATRAELCLRVQGPWAAGAQWRLRWSIADDGAGLPEAADALTGEGLWSRGNGLAGVRERVWSHGADLLIERGLGGRGLRLSALMTTPTLAPAGPHPEILEDVPHDENR